MIKSGNICKPFYLPFDLSQPDQAPDSQCFLKQLFLSIMYWVFVKKNQKYVKQIIFMTVVN